VSTPPSSVFLVPDPAIEAVVHEIGECLRVNGSARLAGDFLPQGRVCAIDGVSASIPRRTNSKPYAARQMNWSDRCSPQFHSSGRECRKVQRQPRHNLL